MLLLLILITSHFRLLLKLDCTVFLNLCIKIFGNNTCYVFFDNCFYKHVEINLITKFSRSILHEIDADVLQMKLYLLDLSRDRYWRHLLRCINVLSGKSSYQETFNFWTRSSKKTLMHDVLSSETKRYFQLGEKSIFSAMNIPYSNGRIFRVNVRENRPQIIDPIQFGRSPLSHDIAYHSLHELTRKEIKNVWIILYITGGFR